MIMKNRHSSRSRLQIAALLLRTSNFEVRNTVACIYCAQCEHWKLGLKMNFTLRMIQEKMFENFQLKVSIFDENNAWHVCLNAVLETGKTLANPVTWWKHHQLDKMYQRQGSSGNNWQQEYKLEQQKQEVLQLRHEASIKRINVSQGD